MGLLEKINRPQDLHRLSMTEMNRLAQEIREMIIDTVSKNGGHLASNLGVVELTLALHRVFNSPVHAGTAKSAPFLLFFLGLSVQNSQLFPSSPL